MAEQGKKEAKNEAAKKVANRFAPSAPPLRMVKGGGYCTPSVLLGNNSGKHLAVRSSKDSKNNGDNRHGDEQMPNAETPYQPGRNARVNLAGQFQLLKLQIANLDE